MIMKLIEKNARNESHKNVTWYFEKIPGWNTSQNITLASAGEVKTNS